MSCSFVLVVSNNTLLYRLRVHVVITRIYNNHTRSTMVVHYTSTDVTYFVLTFRTEHLNRKERSKRSDVRL